MVRLVESRTEVVQPWGLSVGDGGSATLRHDKRDGRIDAPGA
jgi:hypothetical protein